MHQAARCTVTERGCIDSTPALQPPRRIAPGPGRAFAAQPPTTLVANSPRNVSRRSSRNPRHHQGPPLLQGDTGHDVPHAACNTPEGPGLLLVVVKPVGQSKVVRGHNPTHPGGPVLPQKPCPRPGCCCCKGMPAAGPPGVSLQQPPHGASAKVTSNTALSTSMCRAQRRAHQQHQDSALHRFRSRCCRAAGT
jgi:hypothetical protein